MVLTDGCFFDMSKKVNHKTHPASPNRDQLASVRRLLDRGDVEMARQRLAALRKSFPSFKPLLALAWEVEDALGDPMRATARALEWHQASPNSMAALQALCNSAGLAGLPIIYGRILGQLAVMQGRAAVELPASMDTPLGPLSLKQAEALDLGRLHLADENPTAAMAALEGVDHPSARNNYALALFLAGDVTQACAMMEANWRADPVNLYALGSAVFWRCWLEGMDACLGYMEPLQQTVPLRCQDAIAQILALRFLGDEKAVVKAWEDAAGADYWQDADADQRQLFENLHEPWTELKGSNEIWFSNVWIKKLLAISQDFRGVSDLQWERRSNDLIGNCDAHVDYLVRAAVLGDELIRWLALSVLKRRAKNANTMALAGLKAWLTYSKGTDIARKEIFGWLIEEGLIDINEPTDVWLNGALQNVCSQKLTITDEPQDSPFPPQGTQLNERVHEAIRSGNLHVAFDLASELLQMHPEQPSALSNLAAIKEGLGHDAEEIAALYRRAFALAPDYLFARCGLARAWVSEGQVDKATQLLKGLLGREVFHRSEYRAFLLAHKALALAKGDKLAAQSMEQLIADL